MVVTIPPLLTLLSSTEQRACQVGGGLPLTEARSSAGGPTPALTPLLAISVPCCCVTKVSGLHTNQRLSVRSTREKLLLVAGWRWCAAAVTGRKHLYGPRAASPERCLIEDCHRSGSNVAQQ